MRLDRLCRAPGALRPPVETTAGKALLREPKTLRVVDQNLDGCASPVAEHEHRPGHRIGVQHCPAQEREAVNAALEEFIARRKQKKILDLFGEVDWDSRYDYKAERRKR